MPNHKVILRVDSGEGKVINKMYVDKTKQEIVAVLRELSQGDSNVQFVPLDVGDYEFIVDGVRVLIIERKEISDLMSSISDQRFREQRGRLIMERRDSKTHLNVAFLIEGDLAGLDNGMSRAFNGDFYRDRLNDLASTYEMGLMITRDEADTVQRLATIKKRLSEKGTLSNIEAGMDLVDVLPVGRKRNITAAEWNILALARIPSITVPAAKAIYETHGPIGKLWSEWALNPATAARVGALADIEYDGKKLGYAKSRNVYEYITGETLPANLRRAPRRDASPKRRPKKASS